MVAAAAAIGFIGQRGFAAMHFFSNVPGFFWWFGIGNL